ncbi:MAG: flagellar hook-basal body complex protein FliE [Xanthobacteraceae bacterium]|jgi:flagellar hook-basal body complex protein FliE
MASPITAANAYAKLARLADPGANPLKEKPSDSAGPNFGAMVKEAIGSVVEAGRKSDGQAQAMAAGKANIVDVVTAVSETEVAVEAMVSVRDKVIQAYEEIMRMPI